MTQVLGISNNKFQGAGKITYGYSSGGSHNVQEKNEQPQSGENVRALLNGESVSFNTGNDIRKYNHINNTNNKTSLFLQSGNTYKVDGEIGDKFENTSQAEQGYGNPTQVQLAKKDDQSNIRADKIMGSTSAGDVNETSDGDMYSTETYFKGANDEQIGIGANTSDDKNAKDAGDEFATHMNELAKKNDDKSQLDKMEELAKGNQAAQNALKAFKDATYEKDAQGNLIAKNYSEDLDGAQKAAETVRKAAQDYNNALREGCTDTNGLNEILTEMVKTDAELRDIAEGDQNNTTAPVVNIDNKQDDSKTDPVSSIETNSTDKETSKSDPPSKETAEKEKQTEEKQKNIAKNFLNNLIKKVFGMTGKEQQTAANKVLNKYSDDLSSSQTYSLREIADKNIEMET